MKVTFTSSVEGIHGLLLTVHRNTYAVPAVPVKVEVGLPALPNDPPVPDTTLQDPVPTEGVLAASVTVVRPQVDEPV